MKLVPGLRPRDLSQETASLSRGGWFRSIKYIDKKKMSKMIPNMFGPEGALVNISASRICQPNNQRKITGKQTLYVSILLVLSFLLLHHDTFSR